MKRFFVSIFLAFYAMANVLLLYKGNEEDYGTSCLKANVVPALEDLREPYEFADINKGFPDLSKYELIVNCYYSPNVKHAKRCLNNLVEYIRDGGKILIINNLGASVDEDGQRPHPI